MILVIGVEEGTWGWSDCGVALCGGGAGSTPMGASTLVCRDAISGRRVLLLSLSGGGECSSVVGVGIKTLFGCQSLPCGSSEAATILYVWFSHEYVESVVLM